MHSVVAFKQQKNVSNAKYAKQVVNRQELAIFTCGKFTFGLEVYEKVSQTYPSTTTSPITIIKYLQLPQDKQSPIDDLVQERTVARLIVKFFLNNRLKEHLMTAFTTGDNNCYPDIISNALLLLSTFGDKETYYLRCLHFYIPTLARHTWETRVCVGLDAIHYKDFREGTRN